jgi:hypothetical protein
MTRKNRIPKTFNRKLKDLDDHLYFLKESLAKLVNGDHAYIKSLAGELRVLVCKASGTEGLVWRLIDEMHLFDDVHVHLAGNVDRNHSLAKGLSFVFIPIFRAGQGDPRLPPAHYSLKKIIKECEAVVVSGDGHSHEKLIRAVAEQMGSAHEDEGVEPHLVELERMIVSNQAALNSVLMSEADLVLEIGEKVLNEAKQQIGFERRERPEIVIPSLPVKYDSNTQDVDFEGNISFLPSEGTVAFQVNHHHADWKTNEAVYDFGLFKQGPLSVCITKYPDKTMKISIEGLADDIITIRKPMPQSIHPGVMIAITWNKSEAIFYLNGEHVGTIQYDKKDFS